MKKILALTLVTVAVCMLFSGCALRCKIKGHDFELTTAGKDATCTEEGATEGRKCKVCGYEEEPTVIPAKGHVEVTEEGKKATWIEEGTTDKKYCSVCGEVLMEHEKIEALINGEDRYNSDEPIYLVKKVEEGFDDWDSIEKQSINVQNWGPNQVAYDYDPESVFQVVHTENSLIIRFTSNNDYPFSFMTHTNDIVCDDACNEFFVTLADDPDNYFNFEMNSNGALYVGYGPEAHNRSVVDVEIIEKYTKTELEEEVLDEDERGFWGITLTIDKQFFKEVAGVDIEDGLIKGSFYKCGARIPGTNHLLAWTTIPDTRFGFHTPSSFGNIILE